MITILNKQGSHACSNDLPMNQLMQHTVAVLMRRTVPPDSLRLHGRQSARCWRAFATTTTTTAAALLRWLRGRRCRRSRPRSEERLRLVGDALPGGRDEDQDWLTRGRVIEADVDCGVAIRPCAFAIAATDRVADIHDDRLARWRRLARPLHRLILHAAGDVDRNRVAEFRRGVRWPCADGEWRKIRRRSQVGAVGRRNEDSIAIVRCGVWRLAGDQRHGDDAK
jgi:hypothetical protein